MSVENTYNYDEAILFQNFKFRLNYQIKNYSGKKVK